MTTSNLSSYVKNNFNGMLVVGDIHSDYESVLRAFDYAEANNYFFLSLGDLVDRGPMPFETVTAVLRRMRDGRAGFVVGNHDDKFYRFYKGAKVTLSRDARNTLDNVGSERQYAFLRMYADIVEMPIVSGIFHIFDDIILVHAASHPCMWEATERFGSTAKSRALYGETNGEVYDDGYPVRLYSWVNEIPMGKTVVVGHDKMAVYNLPLSEPLVKTNASGGKAIFMDTGCGKGGFLSGAVIVNDGQVFKFEKFVEFK